MTRRFLLIAAGTVFTAAVAGAKNPKNKDKGHGNPHGNKHGGEGYGRFRQEDVREIEYYYGNPSAGLPPGLAKRGGDLPPGLAKKLQRDGQLPPGLQKRIQPFPVELERRLPPLGPGMRRGFLSGRAIIYNERTNVILDIFVLPGR